MGPTSLTLSLPREVLITRHMPMAARIARGFAGRGEDLDDLTQVAMLELIKAVSRFDPGRGVDFARYAYPCIVGGLKRHFRDTGWSLHITRRMQELHLQTRRAVPALTQQLGRHPSTADLATHLNLSEKDTRDGVNSRMAYNTRSLSVKIADGDTELEWTLGGLDPSLEAVPDRHLLGMHLAKLPLRERNILRLRFAVGLSQREIAEQLGISQMHVSRLITGAVLRLRAGLMSA